MPVRQCLPGAPGAAVQVMAEAGVAGLSLSEAARRMGIQGLDHQVIAQLLNWRPAPGFEPSSAAFAPNIEFAEEVRRLLQE